MMSEPHDWDAGEYVAHSSSQQEWARELVAKLRLRGDERLLDIGCGDGRVAASIAARLPEGAVLGIDASASMISLAAKQFPSHRHPNLEFRQMDARRIELAAAFDVAFSTAALHWVDDHEAVLGGVRSSLKTGGHLLVQMGGRGNVADALAIVDDMIARPQWSPYFDGFEPSYHFYSPEDYERWLPRAGFRLIRAELLPKDMRHPGRAGFMGWLRTTWFTYTDQLPEELRDIFLEEVMAGYLAAYPPDEDDVAHVKVVRLEVEALAI